jgi:ribonuclease P protein component
MRKELRLRRRKDFDVVFRKGRALHNDLLVLRSVPNALEHNRYGFVTSKKVGKAVVRNRVRRRLREAVRVLPVEPGWDVVVSAKARASEADFHELNRAVTELLGRAGILNQKPGEDSA